MTGGYAQYYTPDSYRDLLMAYGGAGNQQPTAATSPNPGLPGGGRAGALGPDGQPQGSKGGVNSWGSTLGTIGGVLGMGIPGIGGFALGPAANLAGSFIDAQNANRGLATQGLPTGVTAGPAALSNGMFGLLGALGLGNSIAGQVGDIKNEAARNDPRLNGLLDFTDGTRFTGSAPGGLIGSANKSDMAAQWAGLAPQDKSFFNGLFGDTGGGSPSGNASSDSHSQGGAMSADAAAGFGGGPSSADPGGPMWAKGGKIPPPAWSHAAGGVVGRAGGEAAFQNWFRGLPWFQEFTQQYGEQPNANDPDYNYRRAYRAGVEPERYAPDANRYHWPSVTPAGDDLKGVNHPTRWMEEFMQQNGRDPNEMDGPFQQGYAKGGRVKATPAAMRALGKVDPPGPDDQVAGLQTGEGVINRPAMQSGWNQLIDVINADKGGALAQLLKGLLTQPAAAR